MFNRDTVRQWVNLISAIITIAFNVLAAALPLNGQDTGAISDSFKVLFVPAGYVFSIWGVIYLFWLAFAIYQLLPSQRQNPRLRSIGYWFALSGVLNCLWLVFWHYNVFPLTVAVMLALLAVLIIIYLRLGVGHVQVSAAERWCVDIPFSVYLGWISVAAIANITDLLWYWGWRGAPLSAEFWAIFLLAAGVVIGWLMALTRRDAGYLAVFVWAFAGIAVKQAAVPAVSIAAWVAAALVAAALVVGVFVLRRPVPLFKKIA
jgi:translocator protein